MFTKWGLDVAKECGFNSFVTERLEAKDYF